MTEDEIKALIREYIAEHLDIEVEINRSYAYYDSSPSVKVSIRIDGIVVASSSDTLPRS